MPITIPEELPAFDILRNEGVMVMSEGRAVRQDIRPLRIGLVNLMPKKVQTETQFARVIGATPLQIELTLIRMSFHRSKNAPAGHMEAFYRTFQEVKAQKFDGLIITGAPIEHLEFTDVTYWDEFVEMINWTQTHVHSTFGICWAGMAMLNFHFGVTKRMLDEKLFGCFRHRTIAPSSPYLRGFSDDLVVPVSRWTEMCPSEIRACHELDILIESPATGPCLIEDKAHRSLYMFNHLEYDSDTLRQEYERDVSAGSPIEVPVDYFPEDDASSPPQNRWRAHGHLLYGNWINQIYQTVPFDIALVGSGTCAEPA